VTDGETSASEITLHDLHPSSTRFLADLHAGLSARPRTIPPKYFYDDRGAALFERITRLDAYYLTRVELEILRSRANEIAAAIGPRVRLVELGSGGGRKTRELLERPSLEVTPVCADFTADWGLPEPSAEVGRTVAFFPGSSIGNFEPAEAQDFLRRVGRVCGAGGGLLIGADLHKDRAVLEQAYDDPEGVTAAFNLNLLRRIRREAEGEVELDAFRHIAFYDDARRRVEIRLECTRATAIRLPSEHPGGPSVTYDLEPGDFIRTEYSHKYTLDGFRKLVESVGWREKRVWTDPREWFSVWLLSWVGA
jgi:uncharacterized SAM-dependent methyltransferase